MIELVIRKKRKAGISLSIFSTLIAIMVGVFIWLFVIPWYNVLTQKETWTDLRLTLALLIGVPGLIATIVGFGVSLHIYIKQDRIIKDVTK